MGKSAPHNPPMQTRTFSIDKSSTAAIRAVAWAYGLDITESEAADMARTLADAGVNLVLTEANRYLLYDPPPGTPEPHFHFVPTPRARTLRATTVVTRAMHAMGIRVLHHVTSCYASEDFAAAHQDWTQRDMRRPDAPLFFGDYGGVWLFCPNNPDFRDTFVRSLVDFAERSGVDGWMIDEIEYLPDWFSCACAHCRAWFTRDTGLELPHGEESPAHGNLDDPLWRAWIAWRMTGTAGFLADVRARLGEARPGSILTTCHAGVVDTWSAQYWGCDEVAVSPNIDLVFYEAYVRDGIPSESWPRHVAEMETYMACARGKRLPPLALLYALDEDEARFCWALAASRGFGKWACIPAGPITGPHSRLGGARPEAAFRWQAARARLFRRGDAATNVALLFSKPSRDMVSPMDNSYYIDEWAGWATAMAERNIGFRVVLDRDLATGGLDGANLLLMPNTACISDEDMEAVVRFRRAGGRVVTTGDTAARDETGAPRDDAARAAFVAAMDTHLTDSPGRDALRKYARKGEPAPLPATPEAVGRIADIIDSFPGARVWRAESDDAVSVNVMRHDNGDLTVHLLNTGGALAGHADPPRTVGPQPVGVPDKPARGIRVELRLDAPPAAEPRLHVLWQEQPLPCAAEWDGTTLRISVDELREYAVVEVPVAPGA